MPEPRLDPKDEAGFDGKALLPTVLDGASKRLGSQLRDPPGRRTPEAHSVMLIDSYFLIRTDHQSVSAWVSIIDVQLGKSPVN